MSAGHITVYIRQCPTAILIPVSQTLFDDVICHFPNPFEFLN